MKCTRILGLAVVLLLPTQALAQTADIILINGNVITVDERKPRAEAIAIQGERILAAGSNEEIKHLRESRTHVVDLQGKTVIPGMVDGHLHFVGLGSDRGASLDLSEARSEADVAAQVRRALGRVKRGEWITGGDWHTGNWDREQWPTKGSLDQAAPNNPVLLRGMHGHASWVNSKALEMAGITKNTPDPPGGKILRDDKTGEASGILIENAQALVRNKIPETSREPLKERIKKSIRLALSYGFVGAHDMGTSLQTVEAYKELIDVGEFPFRINAIPRVRNSGALLDEILKRGPLVGYGNHRLTMRGVKLSIDGALGSRGAAMMLPYEDEPHNLGVIRVPYEQLYFILEKSLKAGFNVAIHAIGDRGNQMALDAVEQALLGVPVQDHRIRVEHAQVVQLEDLPRFARLGILASVQWIHCTLDMPWAEKRIGSERIRGAYAWRTLLNHGARLVGGSDEGAKTFSPFMGIFAAVTRQDEKGWPQGGWYPDQKLTRYEALKSYTLDAAYASFEEDVLGSITPGKYADVVVLSKDIMTVPAPEILQTQVLMTMVGGKIVFERKEQ
ncbi:MAG: amidohydrolase [Terriglobia bacterium]